MVYNILNKNGLCDYYAISQNPGSSQKIKVRADKFAFLDDENISASLINYKDAHQTFVTFYLPQVHCSSCLWLLENLHNLNKAVVSSKVNFSRKVFPNSSTLGLFLNATSMILIRDPGAKDRISGCCTMLNYQDWKFIISMRLQMRLQEIQVDII